MRKKEWPVMKIVEPSKDIVKFFELRTRTIIKMLPVGNTLKDDSQGVFDRLTGTVVKKALPLLPDEMVTKLAKLGLNVTDQSFLVAGRYNSNIYYGILIGVLGPTPKESFACVFRGMLKGEVKEVYEALRTKYLREE